MSEYYRVKEAFAYGEHNVATPGQVWSSDNPAFRGREQFFEPVEDAATRTANRAIETASAAPGELRSVHPAKKAPAKKVAPHPAHTEDSKGDN